MVKVLLSLLLIFSSLLSNENYLVEGDDLLTKKIKSFVDDDVYQKNRKFIEIIFPPKSKFYKQDGVGVVKVVATLKGNGLIKLFFKRPKELTLNFKTNGPPLFFVKIMSDTLRNMGYYRYVTTSSNFDGIDFTWSITLTSEYSTDPLILQKELIKSGCRIVDIERSSLTQWTFSVGMVDGFLNVYKLKDRQRIALKRSLYAHWLNVADIQNLVISSSIRNNWYPYVAFYDSSLGLIKVLKRDKKTRRVSIKVPKFATYIKISDIYTLKNLKDELILNPQG